MPAKFEDIAKEMEDLAMAGVRGLIESVRELGDAPIDVVMAEIDAPIRQALKASFGEMMAKLETKVKGEIGRAIDETISDTAESIAGVFDGVVTISGKDAASAVRLAAREFKNGGRMAREAGQVAQRE